MKKLLYIAGFIVAVLFTACDDLLTVESPDKLTSGTFWRNQDDALQGLAASYSMLEAAYDVWEFAEVKWPVEAYREDLVNLGEDALNYPNWVELSNFNYTNGNSQVALFWEANYRGLNYTNQVIEKVGEMSEDKIDPAIKQLIIGEAHFLRAYYHMKVLLNFERIILRDKYATTQADLLVGLSDRNVTWDFIVADFKEAANRLPKERSAGELGRATSNAANAYLGFAYLTMAAEQQDKKSEYLGKAESALLDVTGLSLVKDFISMFDGSNKNSEESVFELQFSETTANGAWYRTALHRWIGVSELDGWDEIVPSQMLMDEFMKEGKTSTLGNYDSRLYASIFFRDPYFNDGTGKVYGSDYDDWFHEWEQDANGNWIAGAAYNKPAFRKYLPRTLAGLGMSRTSLNVPLMRYSNVLLMLAEVYAQQDQPAKAIPLINQVRDRADMPAMTGVTKEEVMAQIEHERIVEFALENFRFYDLRRWGKLEEALHAVGRTNFDVSKHQFYPIPLVEIQANPNVRN